MLQSFSTTFSGHDQNHLAALNDIYSDISRTAAQCSPKYRDNQSKADFLKDAVEKHPWARGNVKEYI
jgi:hypothetical protein